MSTRKILLEDGVNSLLLEDGVNFLIREGTAQASDDVLIRLGPGLTAAIGSGMVTPTFTTPGVGGAVFSPFYYTMMQNWFSE